MGEKFIKNLLRKNLKNIGLENLVHLFGLINPDTSYYTTKYIKNSKLMVALNITTTGIKLSSHVTKKYKRTDYDATIIFDDSIDAINDAF